MATLVYRVVQKNLACLNIPSFLSTDLCSQCTANQPKRNFPLWSWQGFLRDSYSYEPHAHGIFKHLDRQETKLATGAVDVHACLRPPATSNKRFWPDPMIAKNFIGDMISQCKMMIPSTVWIFQAPPLLVSHQEDLFWCGFSQSEVAHSQFKQCRKNNHILKLLR